MVRDNIRHTASHSVSANNNNNLMMRTPSSTQLSIRPRGRPFGSKNKAKPTIVFEENPEVTMKTVLIEIPSGEKIVEALINWAQLHQYSITVLNGVGFVTDVTLINQVSRAPTFPLEGMFYMTSLSGTYLNPYCDNVPPRFITNPVFSSFSICLTHGGGWMFGGIVGATIKAVDGVLITVGLLKKPRFHRLTTYMYGKFLEIEECVDPESNNNDIDCEAMVASSTQLNHQIVSQPLPTNVKPFIGSTSFR